MNSNENQKKDMTKGICKETVKEKGKDEGDM
jgi:hypothetical protein